MACTGMPIEILEAVLLQRLKTERMRVLDSVVASLDADEAREAVWDAFTRQRQTQAEADSGHLVSVDDVLTKRCAALQ